MAFLKIRRRQNEVNNQDNNIAMPMQSKDRLGISDAAAQQIVKLAAPYLRVGIRGGGCSGFSIYYQLEEQPNSNDIIFKKDLAAVVIDKKSLSILGGASLHWQEYLAAGEFTLLNNPAAKQCSCGQSFSL